MLKPKEIERSTGGTILGKHSSRDALAARAKSLGFLLEGDKLDKAFATFVAAGDEVGSLDTEQLLGILSGIESGHRDKPWRFGRIEIRAPVSATARSVARIELEHDERGRVTEIASAPGGLDAAFSAAGQIMGIEARVSTLGVRYVASDSAGSTKNASLMNVIANISIEVDGETFIGHARECDLLPCCIAAFIDAASNAQSVRRIRTTGVQPGADASLDGSLRSIPTKGRW